MKKPIVQSSMLVSAVLLAACQPTNKTQPSEEKRAASVTVASAQSGDQPGHQASDQTGHQTASMTVASTVSNQADQTGAPKQINWALVDSGVKAVDRTRFNYPFALDSEPVKAYAQMYHVDNQTSRYNLTVGMAVNEILSKVLDQIGTDYVSHELTAGKNSAFVIHTTEQIAPSVYTYVFAEPFAKGLTMPVKIVNDGKK